MVPDMRFESRNGNLQQTPTGRANRHKRQNQILRSIDKKIGQLVNEFPKTSVVMLVQSCFSDAFLKSTIVMPGHDTAWCQKLKDTLQKCILQRQRKKCDDIAGMDIDCFVSLGGFEKFMQICELDGILSSMQVKEMIKKKNSILKNEGNSDVIV